ncbi:hypothetical protein GJQ54_12235 [Oceanospirillaceae bacterium ASx5O]|nr:hypothetical protein GJQ54_12235 [Oceanospirillaceae bacterium ASx5O]
MLARNSDTVEIPKMERKRMFRLKFPLAILFSVLLAACGGSSDSVIPETGGNDGGTDTGTDSGPKSSLTYFPLQVFEQGEGYSDEAVFGGIWFDRLIHGYMIAPVDSKTLLPVSNPQVSEFRFTINGQSIDPVEQGLVMQPVIGLPLTMDTAIIIDTSGSTQAVDKAALVAEVKAYIQTAKASSNTTIANQRFTLWAFGTSVEPLVGFFTSDANILNTALDNLITNWNTRGVGSAIYEAIVRGIGTYVGNGAAGSENEIDLSSDGDNDLVDEYRFNAEYGLGRTHITRLNLSSVILFSTGKNSLNLFSQESAQTALNWQSFLVYGEEAAEEDTGDEPADDTSAAPEGMALLSKPLIYVAINEVDPALNTMAATTISTTYTSFANVAEQIITAQQSAVELRTRPENQYLVRYAVLDRDGEYEAIFSSNTNGYQYSLTTQLKFNPAVITPEVQPVVEIAGPANAYLANNSVSVARVQRLYPATRWTVTPYSAASYIWTVGGAERDKAADGSIAISAADVGKAVVLTNNSLSTGTTTATLTITN